MPGRRLTLALVGLRLLLLNVTYFFLPLHLRSLGLEGWWSGVLLGTFAITAFLTAFRTGMLTDRHPIRFLAAIGFGLLAIFNGGLTQVVDPWALLAVFLVGGLGNTLLEIGLVSQVLKSAEQRGAGAWIGAYIGVNGLSIALGMLVGGRYLEQVGFTRVFWIAAAALVVTGLLSLRLPDFPRVRSTLAEYAREASTADALRLTLAFFLLSLHWGAEFTCYTPFLHDTLGLGMRDSGLYMGTAAVGLTLGGLLAGRLHDRGAPLSTLAALALLTSGLGHVAMTLPIPLASWLIRLLHEFGDGASMVVLLVLVQRQFPRERLGGLGAVTATATILGRLLGSVGFAPLGRAFGYGWPLAVSGVLTALALWPLWRVVARATPARVSSTP